MATSYGTDPRDLLRGGSQGAANQQMLDAARAAQRTSPAAPSGVTTQPAANGVADAARQLTGSRVVPPQTPMQNMAESLRASTPTGPTAPTGPAAPTGPTNPSFAGGNPSPQAQAWQASRAAAPTASSAPPAGAVPPAAAAQAAPKAGGLRGAWEATKAFPGRVTSGIGSMLSTGAGLARAGVGPALALTPSSLANGELTPEILSAFDDAKKNGYTGTKTLSDVAVMPNGSQARENIYGKGNPKLSTQPGGTGLPQGASTPSTSAPAPAPSTNNVTRVGNSYSGPAGIKADGMTINGKAPGGSFNVVPAGSFGGVSPSMDAQLSQARMAAANRGDFDAVARSYGGNFAGGSGGQSGLRSGVPTVQNNWDAFQKAKAEGAFEKRQGEGLRQYANRMDAMTKMLGVDMGDLGNQRNNATSFANNENTNATQRRGQDMTAAEKAADRQIAAQKRAALAQIAAVSDGDPRKMADAALRLGYADEAKSFFDLAGNNQQYNTKAYDQAMKLLSGAMPTDEKGNITEGGRATVMSAAAQATPGILSADPQEQIAALPVGLAAGNIVTGLNKTADTSFLPNWLTGNDPVRLSTLPGLNETQGGRMENVGWWEALTNNNVQMGDKALRLPNGQSRYLPKGTVNQNERELLRSMGIDIGQTK